MLKSFVRRRDGIIKKARELSVLCGVEVAVVIFGPDKATPHVWPHNLPNLHSIIQSYFNTTKGKRFGTKIGTKNSKREESSCVDTIDRLSIEKLNELLGKLDSKLERVNSRIDMIKMAHHNPPSDVANRQTAVPLSFQYPNPIDDNEHQDDQFLPDNLDAKLERVNSGTDIMHQNPPLDLGNPEFQYDSSHQDLYFDMEDTSMLSNCTGGFNPVSGNNYNFDYGSQLYGAGPASDLVPVLPVYAPGHNYNFDYGSQVFGACGGSDMPFLPMYTQRPINPNFFSGNMFDLGAQMMATDARVQSANLSGFIPLENMLLQ